MNVLVDTSVWSMALRRPRRAGTAAAAETAELGELIREGRVELMGAIRQEILSGIRTAEQFRKLRDRLRAFPDIALDESDHEEAAACFNRCRAKGLQGSNTDFLMCAVSLRYDLAILTTDKDFDGFARVLGLELHSPRS
jgi:predicted nucleic acid-binding protein